MTAHETPPEDDTDDDDLETPEVEVEAERAEPDDQSTLPPDEVDKEGR